LELNSKVQSFVTYAKIKKFSSGIHHDDDVMMM